MSDTSSVEFARLVKCLEGIRQGTPARALLPRLKVASALLTLGALLVFVEAGPVAVAGYAAAVFVACVSTLAIWAFDRDEAGE